MSKLYCFRIQFAIPEDSGDDTPWYSQRESVIFAGGLAAAARKAYDLCDHKGTEFQIREHQPIVVDGDANQWPGCRAQEMSFGPLYEGVYDPQQVPTLQEIREYLAFVSQTVYKPTFAWEMSEVAY